MGFTAQRLRELIAKGEGETLDFKKRTTHPTRISRTLVSFANSQGGRLLIGVEDNGRIVGVRDAEEEIFLLRQAAEHYIMPPLQLRIEEVEDDARIVLIVTVSESSRKPHKALVAADDWRGYVRVGDESVQTSQITEKVLANEQPESRFEKIPLNKLEEAALDFVRKHPRLTLDQYSKLINVSKRRAYRMLIKLVLHGYLRYHDKEKEPYYTKA
ncbi:AlbA family DNA-binding domain-containing protein [Solirubrum puertoriconensis]|uniref:Transcriptional regulator n=1 Tax=Solirubrum puertoriconensis TaxID=1751427 RepID=A0A9X0L5I7_SOLP1|nr:ATP-binding protein [Solirubrum puertoriconensis]KUG08779.1 transcriptional regulator [Solirubrum puertoriconensis]